MSDTVCVIGLGYVGLPTAALLAAHDMRVVGVDIDAGRVARINRGDPCITEPGLDVLLGQVVRAGMLRATIVPEPADIFLIAVPTPLRPAAQGMDPKPDLSHLHAAALAIAPVLRAGNRIILESTVPVGTTAQLSAWLGRARPDLQLPHVVGEDADIAIAYCPERVLPGRVMHELVHNERVVGGITPTCAARAAHFYGKFVQGEALLTDARTAELCKLAENSFRDVNIAFANELSMISEALAVDVRDVIALANRHPRVTILQPGCGVGGHCLAVDPWFLVNGAPAQAQLIRTARQVNDNKPGWLLERIDAAIRAAHESGMAEAGEVRIACFGLAYKPDVGDLRESPALAIAQKLADRYGDDLAVVEPYLANLPDDLVQAGAHKMDVDEALAWAHVLVVLVNHAQFGDIAEVITETQYVIDARDARGIGRGNQWPQTV